MPCYNPIYAGRAVGSNEFGKRPLRFASDINMLDVPNASKYAVPCGRCIGCRLERSRQWALRCVHEASLYDENCFITLTFNDESLFDWQGRNLPLEDIQSCLRGSLVKADFQNFMKRLREKYPDRKIRYFHCGEYGDLGRPHHHACLFNFCFDDLREAVTDDGSRCFVSDTLDKLWPFGFNSIGEVTFESAAYVARYVLKKWADKGLKGVDLYRAMFEFDEVVAEKDPLYQPEYITMSRKPGIGCGWIEKFMDDVYPKDFITVRGHKCKPPKYYDIKKELDNSVFMLKLKYDRMKRSQGSPDNSLLRLKVRETAIRKDSERIRRKL